MEEREKEVMEENRMKIIDEKEKIFRELLPLLANIARNYEGQAVQIQKLENLIVEQSRIRNMIKGLFSKLFLLIKRVVITIPSGVISKLTRKRK